MGKCVKAFFDSHIEGALVLGRPEILHIDSAELIPNFSTRTGT